MKANLDKNGITNQDAALRQASGQAFYNTSRFKLCDLQTRNSSNSPTISSSTSTASPRTGRTSSKTSRSAIRFFGSEKADALGTLIEKLLSPEINLRPKPVLDGDASFKHPGLDNHAMGTIFEELVRRFNEENNEEAGESWTPRDAVKLMARLIFLPIADDIESGHYSLYDGACGTGGMLAVPEDTHTKPDVLTDSGTITVFGSSHPRWWAYIYLRATSCVFCLGNESPSRTRQGKGSRWRNEHFIEQESSRSRPRLFQMFEGDTVDRILHWDRRRSGNESGIDDLILSIHEFHRYPRFLSYTQSPGRRNNRKGLRSLGTQPATSPAARVRPDSTRS